MSDLTKSILAVVGALIATSLLVVAIWHTAVAFAAVAL